MECGRADRSSRPLCCARGPVGPGGPSGQWSEVESEVEKGSLRVTSGDIGMRSRQASADDELRDDSPTLNAAHVVISLALEGRTDPWRRARRWLGGSLPTWVCFSWPRFARPHRLACVCRPARGAQSRRILTEFCTISGGRASVSVARQAPLRIHVDKKKLLQCPDTSLRRVHGPEYVRQNRHRTEARRHSLALVQQ